LKAD
jgi:hypothetical protein